MSNDEQDLAEAIDEDMIGSDAVTSDQTAYDEFPPDRPHGIQFADADVTDESLADRTAQEEPEVWEAEPVPAADIADPMEALEAESAEG